MLENWRAKEENVDAIAAARQKDPFAVLGPHLTDDGWAIRAFVTDAPIKHTPYRREPRASYPTIH